MEVLVFGAGSLGSLLGGLLARVHDVTLVGRDPHVSRVRADGLCVVGAGGDGTEETVRPATTTDAAGRSADLALVTVKTYDTDAAADALADGDYGAVCSLQNGLTEERLADRLDAPVFAGTATYGALLSAPGVVECTGAGRVVLGPRGGGTHPLAERAGDAFRDAGVRILVADDMPRRRWEKLAVNAGINATTALARVENGALADGPAGPLARRAAREAARAARGEGVRLPDRRALEQFDRVVETTAANRSSMLRDVERGRRTEVDDINGAVAERAAAAGFDAPANRALADLVRAWEAERGLR